MVQGIAYNDIRSLGTSAGKLPQIFCALCLLPACTLFTSSFLSSLAPFFPRSLPPSLPPLSLSLSFPLSSPSHNNFSQPDSEQRNTVTINHIATPIQSIQAPAPVPHRSGHIERLRRGGSVPPAVPLPSPSFGTAGAHSRRAKRLIAAREARPRLAATMPPTALGGDTMPAMRSLGGGGTGGGTGGRSGCGGGRGRWFVATPGGPVTTRGPEPWPRCPDNGPPETTARHMGDERNVPEYGPPAEYGVETVSQDTWAENPKV